MYEENAVREANLYRKDGAVISDEAAQMLAGLWSTHGGELNSELRYLAETGRAVPELADAVAKVRREKLTDRRDGNEETIDALCVELDALIAWAQAKTGATA